MYPGNEPFCRNTVRKGEGGFMSPCLVPAIEDWEGEGQEMVGWSEAALRAFVFLYS